MVEKSQFLVSVERRVAYKTTTFPCSSLNLDGTLLSTCGLVIASKPRRKPGERPANLFFRRNGTKPNTPIRRNGESHRHSWWEGYMQHVTSLYRTCVCHLWPLQLAWHTHEAREYFSDGTILWAAYRDCHGSVCNKKYNRVVYLIYKDTKTPCRVRFPAQSSARHYTKKTRCKGGQ